MIEMENDKPSKKVIAFGEVLLRFSPPERSTILNTASMDIHVGGAELNVCCALSSLGLDSSILTFLPDNPLGHKALSFIRHASIDTSRVRMSKRGRMGAYFLEVGASPRVSRVIYDRKDSSFSQEKLEHIDWSRELRGFSHFHTTGITPALSASALAAIVKAATTSSEMGISSSFDINYRSQLWGVDEARDALMKLAQLFDHLIVPRFELKRIFSLKIDEPEQSALELLKRFDLTTVAVTSRHEIMPGIMKWSAFAVDSTGAYPSVERSAIVLDPIGAGDAFCAGYIKGLIEKDLNIGLKTGCALAATKITLKGDALVCHAEELEDITESSDGPIINR